MNPREYTEYIKEYLDNVNKARLSKNENIDVKEVKKKTKEKYKKLYEDNAEKTSEQ